MKDMPFRRRLLATILCLPEALGDDGVIVGSEVPNLHLLARQPRTRGLFVSEDVDVAFFRESTSRSLRKLDGWKSSKEEPSILSPVDPTKHVEINLLGIDPDLPLDEAAVNRRGGYVVFGTLNLIQRTTVVIEDVELPVASLPTIALEKLATARTGLKGDRDLQVALMAVELMDTEEHIVLKGMIRRLPHEYRHHAAVGLAALYTELGRMHAKKGERLRERLRGLISPADLDLEDLT